MKEIDQDIEKIREEVRAELTVKFEAEYTKKIDEMQARLQEANKKQMEEVLKEWQAAQQPPTQEEINQLLNQEYFEFKVRLPDPDNGETEREFVIRELPQTVERLFYKRIKEHILPKLNELSDITVRLTDSDIENKLLAVIELFEPSFDILAETTSIILNPFGKNSVTPKWVQ